MEQAAGKLLQQVPNNTFGETHLYTVENERGETDTSFEKEMIGIEATAAKLIDAIEGAVEQGRAPTFSASEKANLDLFFKQHGNANLPPISSEKPIP
ncbi:DUF4238 domain-containing protein [Limimaricola pyoseonensis]|uniref:DUF4238 domain-containing protein n=1 Tax=Limimaricola pyoseonensis TaxID=521013 RepID=UPI001041C4B5|nr:DUF4238 domain-containing protein [Limimaricola pyoseonensis]